MNMFTSAPSVFSVNYQVRTYRMILDGCVQRYIQGLYSDIFIACYPGKDDMLPKSAH